MIVVQKTTSAQPHQIGVVTKVVVSVDGRGPQGKDGERGPAGELIITEPADPGDSFTLALEGAMI